MTSDKNQISIEKMPPSVVRTVPQAGDTEVDPTLNEIQVTFSKDMMTEEMWSWCYHSPETFPEIDKDGIHYLEDGRTCVLPVELEPDTTYAIWINSQQHQSFKDLQQQSAIPYLLVFSTGEAPSELIQMVKRVAEGIVREWVDLIDREQFAESWEQAASYFKQSISQEQWEQSIQIVRMPLGECLSRELISCEYHDSLPGAPDGQYVVIQYKTSFENKKVAVETITPMLDDDDVWRVSGYYLK